MRFRFEFIGKMPLIMHHDNIEGQDAVKEWQGGKEGKASSKGDDRCPAWTWHTYLYHDGENVVIPSDNVMSALLLAAERTSKLKPDGTLVGKGSYKDVSQTGLLIDEEFLTLLTPEKPVSVKAIEKLHDLPFSVQAEKVKALGFRLYMKSVTIGKGKHKRVRPMFEHWRCLGHVEVTDKAISEAALKEIFRNVGKVGLGDRRPGVKYPKIPGRFGVFDVKLKQI